MIVNQLIFTVVSFAVFVYVFYKLVRENNTKYVPILAIQAIGIAIKFISIIFNKEEISIISEIIAYTLSIIFPIVVLILQKTTKNSKMNLSIVLARICLLFENTKIAKNLLIKTVTENPENYMAHKLLAEIYEKEGGQRKAVDEYIQAIQIDKTDYNSYYKVANLLIDLDKKQDAEQMLTSLLERKPDYVEASITLGDLLIEKEDYKDAVNIYLEALKLNPSSYELNYNLGIVYTMLNDFQNAKTCYEKATELNTLAYNSQYSLAEIAMIYKELDEAEKYLLQVVDEPELSADAYLELAKIYIIRNDKDTAIKYANIAIQEEPKRIVDKIRKDVAFAIIMSKLSIPFNLEENKEIDRKLTAKEIKAKKHLEEMVEITKKIGYSDLKVNKKREENKKEITDKGITRE